MHDDTPVSSLVQPKVLWWSCVVRETGKGKKVSRELESPATLHITPGAECCFPDPCGHDNKDIGNPDERIPETIPENHGDGDAIAITGNQDIRVPDVIEGDNGLRARSPLTTEDAEKEDAEEGDAEKGGRTRKPPGRTQEEEQKDTSPGDTSTGQEGPEERERRHVPRGTWLSECRFPDPCGHDNKDSGNPEERIPETIPENHGYGDAIAVTGNPDIRVPDVLEGDDGLRARNALTTEDAEKEDAEEGDAEKGGRTRKPPGRTKEEEQKDTSPGDNSTGQEGPEERERRHVPRGTWLSQERS
ncbi:hypothetical protein NDU88_005404 [Pleurodeles waltl]|uniref:Uncharacterized protein n=1 Tax=Pleurodeles waltl TaxID=8319 RepID=A0AAV7PFF4_PLEWA|nr:hypothetical protein NDU88_005404 [Pleurodeles waltl]